MLMTSHQRRKKATFYARNNPKQYIQLHEQSKTKSTKFEARELLQEKKNLHMLSTNLIRFNDNITITSQNSGEHI